jgi:hypothetical protein
MITEDWVLTMTYDDDSAPDVTDAWEDKLAELDASVAHLPARRIDVTVYGDGELSMREVLDKVGAHVTQVVGLEPVGVEIVRESEFTRRAESPTLPELVSASEVGDMLGVARQRVHQLRSTAAFPAPLAELRGGAVWDAAAVRKFAREWERKPGRPSRRLTYRNSDGRMIDLDYLRSHGISLTKAEIDSMSSEELDRIIGSCG